MGREKKKISFADKLMVLCLLIMFVFGFLIALRYGVRTFVVNRYGIQNEFTDWILEVKKTEEVVVPVAYIDWGAEYPFSEEDLQTEETLEAEENQEKPMIVQKVDDFSAAIMDEVLPHKYMINALATTDMYGYQQLNYAANKVESLMGWNLAAYAEYNSIVKLSDGYLVGYATAQDTEENAESVIGLNSYCESIGASFLYVQAPYKISEYEDTSISGVVDFANQNANSLLAGIEEQKVDSLDIRDAIWDQGLNHHSLFYRTDHHWTGEAGVWAAGVIAEELNKRYGYEIATSFYNLRQYDTVFYEDYFLGSQGRKVTLAKTKPDDFTLLYPKFETEIHYQIPTMAKDEVGDFTVMYDMSQVSEIDYYNKSPYLVYNYGERPVIRIENLKADNELKVVMIRDSFGDVVSPFLALGVEELITIDLRYFSGSLKTFLAEEEPDLVILMYNAGAVGSETDWSTHTSMFDFR